MQGREFVHVVAGRQLPPFHRQREDRELHDVLAGDQQIEEAKLQRRDQVLGIVHHDRGVTDAPGGLVARDGFQDLIEAIRLRRRARIAQEDRRNPVVQRRHLGDRLLGRGIVRVDADENAIFFVVDVPQRRAEHRADDRGLVPRRDHQRDVFLRLREQHLQAQPAMRAVEEASAPPAPEEIRAEERELLEAEQEKDDARTQDNHPSDDLDRVCDCRVDHPALADWSSSRCR